MCAPSTDQAVAHMGACVSRQHLPPHPLRITDKVASSDRGDMCLVVGMYTLRCMRRSRNGTCWQHVSSVANAPNLLLAADSDLSQTPALGGFRFRCRAMLRHLGLLPAHTLLTSSTACRMDTTAQPPAALFVCQ
ncbi:hypothetical protein HaLaN_02250, partial [Haematococcus lacustris]